MKSSSDGSNGRREGKGDRHNVCSIVGALDHIDVVSRCFCLSSTYNYPM